MVNFNKIYHFSRFQRGPTFSRGVQLFQGGGGFNCLFPIETHITCDFPGGVRTPCPPSGSALAANEVDKRLVTHVLTVSHRYVLTPGERIRHFKRISRVSELSYK